MSTQSIKLRQFILLTLFGALMYVSQVVMSALPNIELVSLLIVVYTRKFGWKALMPIYIFVGCEILTYGLEIWVVNYLYVWIVLWFAVMLIRRVDSIIVYALLSAIFGLMFGSLCSIPYFFMGGWGAGVAYIVKGIPFDVIHTVGNFISVIVLYKPLSLVLDKSVKL